MALHVGLFSLLFIHQEAAIRIIVRIHGKLSSQFMLLKYICVHYKYIYMPGLIMEARQIRFHVERNRTGYSLTSHRTGLRGSSFSGGVCSVVKTKAVVGSTVMFWFSDSQPIW